MDSQITFRCNKEDILRWKAKALAYGVELAVYIRLLLDSEVESEQPKFKSKKK